MIMRMTMSIFAVMIVRVMMILPQQKCADEIDGKSNKGDADRFVKMNLQRNKKSMDGFARHQKCNHRKDHRIGESTEHADFPSAETELYVRCVPPREVISDRGDEERGDVRAHVPAVGQQRH